MSSCNNTCHNQTTKCTTGNGYLIVLVIYILLAIILGSYYII